MYLKLSQDVEYCLLVIGSGGISISPCTILSSSISCSCSVLSHVTPSRGSITRRCSILYVFSHVVNISRSSVVVLFVLCLGV